MKTRLAFLFCSISSPCFAGFIYAYNVDGDPTCIQVGDTCALDNPTETFWDRSTYANPRFAWITESTYDETASVQAASDLYLGESMSGYSAFYGTHTMYGGTGYGFAQFELSWNVEIIGAWGGVTVLGPGIVEWSNPSNYHEIGSKWSDPIPMLWGEPFPFSFSVSGALSNESGDCCGGMDLTAHVTGWRYWAPPVMAPTPEATTLALTAFGVLALLVARQCARPPFRLGTQDRSTARRI